MAFRKISYLIASCNGCGLAWSFGDLACSEGIPPHFATRAAGMAKLPADYGWVVTRRRLRRPVMMCRRCAAAGVIQAGARQRSLTPAVRVLRRLLPGRARLTGPGRGHPESLTVGLPAWQEDLLAEIDAEVFPRRGRRAHGGLAEGEAA